MRLPAAGARSPAKSPVFDAATFRYKHVLISLLRRRGAFAIAEAQSQKAPKNDQQQA